MANSAYEDLKSLLREANVDGHGLEMFVIAVTPELAPRLLQNNDNIRALKESALTKYTTDMLLDAWELNGEALIFDKHGKLRNGQHRLEACIRSGRPFNTVAIIGVDRQAEITMDTGSRRELADFLKKQGYADAKNLAAAIRLSYQLLENKQIAQNNPYLTNEVLITWFRKHESLVDDLNRVKLWKSGFSGTGFTVTYAAAIRHVAGFAELVNVEDVDDFYAQFAQAVDSINTRSSAYKLRHLFTRSHAVTGKGDRIQQPVRVALTIKALNCHLQGREPTGTDLLWRAGGKENEPFPQIDPGELARAAAELQTVS